ncbi:hypothetical protein PROVRETT_05578 [Providencia rettgeri DSM 1131]|nr:hypothetical protein PROVRETT_05578 [Providencia rettgeri DSM 1131]
MLIQSFLSIQVMRPIKYVYFIKPIRGVLSVLNFKKPIKIGFSASFAYSVAM